jgi:hypothetical protein
MHISSHYTHHIYQLHIFLIVNYMGFCISFYIYHARHFMLCISTYASYHKHLIICIASYMHMILCIPIYVLNCTHLYLCYVYCLVHSNCCWNSLHTNRRTDRQTLSCKELLSQLKISKLRMFGNLSQCLDHKYMRTTRHSKGIKFSNVHHLLIFKRHRSMDLVAS